LAAAQGRRRTDPIEDLAALRFGVRIDQPGRIERDFQTSIRRRPGAKPEPMPLSYRYYLSDAVFVAGVEGHEKLLDGLDEALQTPQFPLFLGRRACAPTEPLSLGVHPGSLEDSLRAIEWQAATWYRRQQYQVVHLELALDAPPGDVLAESVRDVPISYDPTRREYGWRDIMRPTERVVVPNPGGRSEPDFLAALGGG